MRLNYIDNIDCLRGLQEIPDNSVDLIIADPPYGIDFQSNRIKDKDRRKPKIANDKTPFIWWLYDAARVLKDTGAVVCFARWDVQEAFRDCIEIAGLKVQNVCIWSKGGGGMGNLKASFIPDHEVFLFATKPGFCFPAKRPSSVLSVAKVPSGKLVHPNEKPVELISQLIEYLTPPTAPGAVVLDPFMGSGTTAVACVRTGRNFIGFELDDQYHQIALARVAAEREEETWML
jgi:site-specific DNA-methyltransferase (adenine-specific)